MLLPDGTKLREKEIREEGLAEWALGTIANVNTALYVICIC